MIISTIKNYLRKTILTIIFFLSISTLFCQQNQTSVFSYNYDLQIKSATAIFDKNTNRFVINSTIFNAGLKTAENFSFIIFLSSSYSNIIDSVYDIVLFNKKIDSLVSKDSLSFSTTFQFNGKGTKKLKFLIDYSRDMKPDNNFKIVNILYPLPKFSVMINEVMFNPQINCSEYIELYNNTIDTINIINWKLFDQFLTSGKRNELLIERDIYLLPNDYFTIAADSSIFITFPYLQNLREKVYVLNKFSLNLNNDEDDVVFVDINGFTQDSMRYSEKWHNPNLSITKGVSIEKINFSLSSWNKENWSSSTSIIGGTPSKQNSIIKKDENVEDKITISPNPFSPDRDGFEDITNITIKSIFNNSLLRIRIFDKAGRLIRTLINNKPITNNYEVSWDGTDDEGNYLKVGIYIIFVELIDDSQGLIKNYKLPVVIAKKL